MSPVGAPFRPFSELRPLPSNIHADLVLHSSGVVSPSPALLIKNGGDQTEYSDLAEPTPMAAAGQDRGAAPAAAAPALGRQLSYSCSRGRAEAMHDRKLSYSYSFSTPAASPPPSSKSSCESIPVPELDRQSSSSSASSYESFYQFEAAAEPGDDCFVPATQPPAVQTMMAQRQPAGAGAGGYDPKRLPSSMFRTRSTCPTEWSAATNESLFSIQLGQSGEVGSLYGDLYYDASGAFHGMSSAGRDDLMQPAVSEASAGGANGGLCVKDNCASCKSSGRGMKYAKSVRFAATTSVRSESKHPPAFPILAGALEEEAPAKEADAAAEGRCWFGCCWPSPPSLWCACRGCECRCWDCRWS